MSVVSGAPVVIIGMTYEVHSFRFVKFSRERRDVVEFPLEDLPLQFFSSIIPLLVIGREIPRYFLISAVVPAAKMASAAVGMS